MVMRTDTKSIYGFLSWIVPSAGLTPPNVAADKLTFSISIKKPPVGWFLVVWWRRRLPN